MAAEYLRLWDSWQSPDRDFSVERKRIRDFAERAWREETQEFSRDLAEVYRRSSNDTVEGREAKSAVAWAYQLCPEDRLAGDMGPFLTEALADGLLAQDLVEPAIDLYVETSGAALRQALWNYVFETGQLYSHGPYHESLLVEFAREFRREDVPQFIAGLRFNKGLYPHTVRLSSLLCLQLMTGQFFGMDLSNGKEGGPSWAASYPWAISKDPAQAIKAAKAYEEWYRGHKHLSDADFFLAAFRGNLAAAGWYTSSAGSPVCNLEWLMGIGPPVARQEPTIWLCPLYDDILAWWKQAEGTLVWNPGTRTLDSPFVPDFPRY